MASELTADDLYHEMPALCISLSLAMAGSSLLAIARRHDEIGNDENEILEGRQEEIALS